MSKASKRKVSELKSLRKSSEQLSQEEWTSSNMLALNSKNRKETQNEGKEWNQEKEQNPEKM